jgi:selenide,water dikinase
LRDILKNTYGIPVPEQFSDPQTSGGLLITCAPNSVEKVLQIFHATGFETAAVIGQIRSGEGLKISV